MTGMAVKVNFRMADFTESEFLQQIRLWDAVFIPFAKIHANISHFFRDIAFKFSKWRPPPSLIFSKVKSKGKSVFGTSFSFCNTFCANTFNNDRVVAINVNFKMAAAAILDFAGIDF